MNIVTRAQASQLELTHYFTGKPCIYGHLSKRRTKDRVCMECNKLVRAKVRAEQPEKIKAQKKKSYEQTKERHLTQKREYRQANKGKIAALNAARKAYIKQRTPKWLTVIDKERIQNEYKLAALQSKITGEPWHVDHVIPLQGKYVSGLHVPSNLKAIRGVENISKKNRFEVNYAK